MQDVGPKIIDIALTTAVSLVLWLIMFWLLWIPFQPGLNNHFQDADRFIEEVEKPMPDRARVSADTAKLVARIEQNREQKNHVGLLSLILSQSVLWLSLHFNLRPERTKERRRAGQKERSDAESKPKPRLPIKEYPEGEGDPEKEV